MNFVLTDDKKVPDMPKEEATIADPAEDEIESLVEQSATQSHYIVCADHFILFEDVDYAQENEERLHFDKGEIQMFQAIDAGVVGMANQQNAAKKAPAVAKPNEQNVNELVMKNLKKLLGNNLSGLLNNGNSGGGGVTANNAIRRRRPNNQGGGYNSNNRSNGNTVRSGGGNNRRFI